LGPVVVISDPPSLALMIVVWDAVKKADGKYFNVALHCCSVQVGLDVVTRSAGRTMFRHDALQCSAPPQIMPSIMFYCFISSQIALQLMAYILLIKS